MKSVYQYYAPSLTDGQILPVHAYGRFLTLLSNTSSTPIKISIGDTPFQNLPFGLSVELPPANNFTILRFQNDSGATVTIEFCISAGRIYDNRVNLSGDIDVTDISDILQTPAAITALDVNYLINNAAANLLGGGLVGIPLTSHPFATGETVTIANTVAYDGNYVIQSQTANEVVILHAQTGETFDGVNDSIGLTSPRKLAADTTQKEAIIQNNSIYDIWVGDVNVLVSSSRGTKIGQDDIIILSTTDDIHFQSDSAGVGGATVSINRLLKT